MESRRISLFKALSWRVIATVVTVSIAYAWSHDVTVAASIGAADSAIKILAYYLHERAWLRAVARELRAIAPDAKSVARSVAGPVTSPVAPAKSC